MALTGLGICVPSSGRPVHLRWAMSLPSLAFPVGMSVGWYVRESKNRAENRNLLAREVRKSGAPFILTLDDDTILPAFAVRWLHAEMMKDPQIGIVGGIYCTKTDPPEPLVFKELGGGPFYNWKVGDVFECAGLGTGCMLIRTEVFEHITEPWFFEPDEVFVDREDGKVREVGTDDLYFCKKVADAGFKIIAHGGVLPVHIDDQGKCYTLPMDSYPCKGTSVKEWANPTLKSDYQPRTGTTKIQNALAIDGWMTPAELYWLAERASEHKAILEVGSFLGRSTRALAENTSGTVHAVDTFEGSFETEPSIQEVLHENHPDKKWFYEQFKRNVADLKNITPVRMRSIPAAKLLKSKFDMIFLDGGHSYEEIKADILAWKKHLKPGGLICGHDFGQKDFPGVEKAVKELLPNFQVAPETSIWHATIEKSNKTQKSRKTK